MYTLKKSLGQHFLKDENICRKIVDELNKQKFDNLLEVGPGGGALTKYLVQVPGINFKAVEIDDEKVVFLKNTYPVLDDKIIHQSFLDIDKPFEMPDYANPQIQNFKMQDLRKTIYWNGNIVTDKNGEASVEFFSADEATIYIGVIRGVTVNGDKIYQTFTLSRN